VNYPQSTKESKAETAPDQQRLVLDGTVHIEEPDEDSAPRVRGLIELFHQFLRQRERG
jgi:hypothetical protein